MAGSCRVSLGGEGAVLAPAHPLDAHDGHQPGYLVTAYVVATTGHLRPQLERPIDAAVGPVSVKYSVGSVRVVPFGPRHGLGPVGVVGAGGDGHVVLGKHSADRLDPEAVPVGVDVSNDQCNRRSSSAAAKNAEAVFRISLARRSSAFSRRNLASSAAVSVVSPARVPESTSARSTQPRRVPGLTSSNSPVRRWAAAADSRTSRRRSWYILTARSLVSWSYFRKAGMAHSLPCEIRASAIPRVVQNNYSADANEKRSRDHFDGVPWCFGVACQLEGTT